MTHDAAFAADLSATLGTRVVALHPVGGGDISRAYRVDLSDGDVCFAKTRAAVPADFFEAEADGLAALAATGTLSVPAVRAVTASWIALDWIDTAPPTPACWEAMGTELAALHHATRGNKHGYARANYIGLTEQANGETFDAVTFWRDERLGPQLDLAQRSGRSTPEIDRLGTRLLDRLGDYLNHDTTSSLLHGDLWSGNVLASPAGKPYLIDPAVYHGPREAELALCHLFGGFDRRFFDAYEAVWPLDSGAGARRPIYALYHLLNHLNLFGSAYAEQVLGVLQRYA